MSMKKHWPWNYAFGDFWSNASFLYGSFYKNHILRKPLRLDMKVEKLVLVDNKAAVDFHPVFQTQMLTYLRVTSLKLGLVINFGERILKAGVHRVVNGLPEGLPN